MAVNGLGRIYNLIKKIASSIGAESSTSSESIVDIVNTLQTNVNSINSTVSSLQSTANTVNSNVNTISSNVNTMNMYIGSGQSSTRGQVSSGTIAMSNRKGKLFIAFPSTSLPTVSSLVIDGASLSTVLLRCFMTAHDTSNTYSNLEIPFGKSISLTVSSSSGFYYAIVCE